MGIFDFLVKAASDWETDNAWDGEGHMECPTCGEPMTKKYMFSDWWCDNCHSGLNDYDDEDTGERLSVSDAADIWMSNGKDEDYMLGYSEEELEDAL